MPLLAALHGVLICLGTLTTVLPYAVYAETAITAEDAKYTFNILPNPLEDALKRFAQQTSIKLSFDAAEIKGIMTQGLQGDFTVQSGLDRLLIDSGFQVMPQADGYAIKKMQESTANAAPSAASSSGVTVLPSVVVAASKGRDYAVAQSVTATKTNTLLRDVPQAITVVTQDLIKDQGMLSMADVVRYVPA